MPITPPKIFAKTADLPRLKAELVQQACARVGEGKGAYRGILYLSFARVHDIETLFEASRSSDIKERWARLWVLAPFITKLTRSQNGRTAIALCLRSDLPALNLLGKFEQKRHASVRRMFSRMHDELLGILLDALVASASDAKRVAIFAQLIALVDTDGQTLERELKQRGVPELLGKLVVKSYGAKKSLNTAAMKDKLVALAPAFPSEDES